MASPSECTGFFSSWKFPAAVAVAGLSVYAAVRLMSRSNRKEEVHRIESIHVYPLKGAKGMKVDRWPLDSRGLKYDRYFAIVETEGRKPIKDNDKLTLLRAVVSEDMQLKITLQTDASVHFSVPVVPRPNAPLMKEVSRLGCECREVTVCDEDPELTAWLCRYLQQDVVLVRASKDARVPHDVKAELGSGALPSDRLSFQAFAHLHILSDEALRWLEAEAGPKMTPPNQTLTAERFRANVVVRAKDATPTAAYPTHEDEWLALALSAPTATSGPAVRKGTLRFAKYCARCVIPTIDDSGVRDPNFQPTKTLREVRALRYPHHVERAAVEGRPLSEVAVEGMFGTEWFLEDMVSESELVVGDELTVIARQRRPKFNSH